MSFFEKIKAGLKKTKENTAANINAVFATFRTVDEDLLSDLEDALILADIGAYVASDAIEELRKYVREGVIAPVLAKYGFDIKNVANIYINPTGNFVIGGPNGDTGLTGRKIIVDTYGGSAPHGGGAFSGKDPTKVDRSAAYAARWVAKNVVAAGLATRCQVQLAYAIGVARPVSVLVETFGTGKVSDEALEAAVEKVFDLRPTAIIRDLDLRKPIYRKLAAYGHMGREDLMAPWEKTDLVPEMQKALL